MHLIQKIILLSLSVCVLATPADAGWKFKPNRRTKVSARTGTVRLPSGSARKRILDKRLERSFQRVKSQLERFSTRPMYEEIIVPQPNRWMKVFPLNPKRLYPDKPYLQHPRRGHQLTQSYFLAQGNRLLLAHLKEMETFWPQFMEAIPRFYEEAEKLQQPADPMLYAARQITASVQNLFVGETHGYFEIPFFVSQLLPQLRKQYPGRKIILFTEFKPDPHSRGKNLAEYAFYAPEEKFYEPVWQAARENDISVVGLEPAYVSIAANTQVQDLHGVSYSYPLWATLEGMRLRNEHWWQVMQKQRAQNPDALFVIYSGSAHSLYNHPFSLAARTPKETTFMLELAPQEMLEEGQHFYSTDNLELMHAPLSFPQPVLHWQANDLAPLSGFDMRIKVPVDLNLKREIQESRWMQLGPTYVPSGADTFSPELK